MDEEGKDWKCVYAEEFETRLGSERTGKKKYLKTGVGREFLWENWKTEVENLRNKVRISQIEYP